MKEVEIIQSLPALYQQKFQEHVAVMENWDIRLAILELYPSEKHVPAILRKYGLEDVQRRLKEKIRDMTIWSEGADCFTDAD